MTRIGAAVLGALLLAVPHTTLLAKQLSTEACAKLVDEYAALQNDGIENVMTLDPSGAKETLEPDQLEKIKRFLFIEGEIEFRCPAAHLPKSKVTLTPENKAPEAEKAEKKEPAQPAGPPVPLPKRKPPQPVRQAG